MYAGPQWQGDVRPVSTLATGSVTGCLSRPLTPPVPTTTALPPSLVFARPPCTSNMHKYHKPHSSSLPGAISCPRLAFGAVADPEGASVTLHIAPDGWACLWQTSRCVASVAWIACRHGGQRQGLTLPSSAGYGQGREQCGGFTRWWELRCGRWLPAHQAEPCAAQRTHA
jgi:hypothetical protein